MRVNNRHITEIFGIYAAIIINRDNISTFDYLIIRNALIAEFESVTSRIPDQIDAMLNK